MPWKCPACSSEIVHSDVERLPHPSVVYRCAVCRLELLFDTRLMQMRHVSVPDESDDRRRDIA
jgi:hypothetical protein